jgi:hypothetical protein
MNKEKMVKVRLLNKGGYDDLQAIKFPVDVYAKKDKNSSGVYVKDSEFGVVCSIISNDGVYWFPRREFDIIEEEPAPQQQQTIEQLLKELAQVNTDGLALANRKNELLGILNLRLNPYGYRLED